MHNQVLMACAGAGKSRVLVEVAITQAGQGKRVLLLTYTVSNQDQLKEKFIELNGYVPNEVVIQGWFSFLLKEMIRPFQNVVFDKRIPSIHFDQRHPHKIVGTKYSLPDRQEKLPDKTLNASHYLTEHAGNVHTTFISKLAVRLHSLTGKASSKRVAEIYDCIFIDEVQDLVGWDYQVLSILSKKPNNIPIKCVGDYRQKIYTTHIGAKTPISSAQKIQWFEDNSFQKTPMNHSWRCSTPICEFADLIHEAEKKYVKTTSKITAKDLEGVPHLGIFAVKRRDAFKYCDEFSPVILKTDVRTESALCTGRKSLNFGLSKGLGFRRVLIIPTARQKEFLKGDRNIFDTGLSKSAPKTDKPKNTFYVAITRAKLSVAFLYDDEDIVEDVTYWSPGDLQTAVNEPL